MPEYIEREALMTEINRIGGHNLCEWDTLGVKALVERQPTADVAEVVRCEKCKYWQKYENTAGAGYCLFKEFSFEYGNERIFNPITMPTHFCSYGERKKR